MATGFLIKLRQSWFTKVLSYCLVILILSQIGFIKRSFALTSGPNQPEYGSFSTAESNQMVDPYSGDFTYNIPLLSVPGPNGGYPISLNYHSGIKMEDEASWVGLGWNVNVGAISRQLRGVPDDFAGEKVKYKLNIKPSTTTSVNLPVGGTEILGFPLPEHNAIGVGGKLYYNNYRGFGYSIGYSIPMGQSFGLGISYDTQTGIGVEPSLSLAGFFGGQIGANINSRTGLQSINFPTLGPVGGPVPQNVPFPTISIPTKTNITMIESKLFGIGGWPFFDYGMLPMSWGISGEHEKTQVADGGNMTKAAYGFLNTNMAKDEDLKDYQAPELQYNRNVPNLPAGNYTHDYFSITGQGMSGMFRAFHSDVSILSKTGIKSTTSGDRIELEFALTFPNWEAGAGYHNIGGESSTGEWKPIKDENQNDNNIVNALSTSVFDEDTYFKMSGETSISYNSDAQLNLALDGPSRAGITKIPGYMKKRFETEGMTNPYKSGRVKRSTFIKKLTKTQALTFGLDKTNVNNCPNDKQIASFEVTQSDGMTYVYGLPVVNKKQVEAIFSVTSPDNTANGANDALNQTIIAPTVYSSNGDINVSNTDQQYLMKTQVPEFVTSWLLTGVVSSDYLDRTNDGLSDDDYGYWVKFEYAKISDDFKWRIPYWGANFNQGSRSFLEEKNDNTGSYLYGEKQVYYLARIITKTHVAIFNAEEKRHDGLEAKNELEGGPGTTQLNCLTSISLYSRPEYGPLSSPNPAAVALQVVHFGYDYFLCPDIPNSTVASAGKLTLLSVWTTYQNSDKGSLSPYSFEYGNISDNDYNNPGYDMRKVDKWGNYKFFSPNAQAVKTEFFYPYFDFPYAHQHGDDDVPAGAIEDAAAPWTLKKIVLPTGGEINITYEPDDYSYVQNKWAGELYDIKGISGPDDQDGANIDAVETSSLRGAGIESLASIKDGSKVDINGTKGIRVYFKLKENTVISQEEFFNRYLKDVGNPYFKVYTYLLSDNTPDYVGGYADLILPPLGTNPALFVKYYGTVWNGTVGYGYISLKLKDAQGAANLVDAKLNPFRKAAFDYLKYERSDIAYEMGTGGDYDVLDFFTEFLLPWNSIAAGLLGFDIYSAGADRAEEIFLNGKSVIRLGCGDGKKIGGNGRVKEIVMTDDGEELSLSEVAYYGQHYDYTIEENGATISSGVADEPLANSEDNVLHQPTAYQYSIPLTSNRSTFIEKPIMESYYPSSQVGYRKVRVKTLAADEQTPITTSLLPETIYEFYTSKEFPVFFSQTDLSNNSPINITLVVPGISNTFIKRIARSQGYSLTLNDMAGKLRSITTQTVPTVTSSSPTVLKRETFEYSTIGDYNPNIANKLNHSILALNESDMKYISAIGGVDYDLFFEMNENKSRDDRFGGDLSLNASFILPGVPFPMFLPFKGVTETSLRTVVFNKILYKSGILKKHIVEDEESKVTFENLVFDSETGDPVITRYNNEFKDNIVKVNFPAHDYYSGMSGSYKNNLIEGINATPLNSDGKINVTAITAFTPGDQIIFSAYHPGELFTVVKVIYPGTIQCIDKNGDYLTTNSSLGTITIAKSGLKNMLSSSVGQIVSKPSPLASFNINDFSGQNFLVDGDDHSILDSVLDASAIEYKSLWQICCADVPVDLSEEETEQTCLTVIMTPELIDLVNLFDHLASIHQLLSSIVYWDSNSDLYPTYLTPPLLAALPQNGTTVQYQAEQSGSNTLNINFGEMCNGLSLIAAGEPVLFDNLIHVYDVQPLSNPIINANGFYYGFTCTGLFVDPDDGNTFTRTLTTETSCIPSGYCNWKINPAYATDCSFGTNQNVDPYQAGFLGIWRPWRSWVYTTDRVNYSDQRAMQFEGIYKDFSLFNWKNTNCNSDKWIRKNEITRYSPYGFELENKDALGIYSSALYGYCNTLNTAVASNARLREIAFDSFEDHGACDQDWCTSCGALHFSFKDASIPLNSSLKHSGNYSAQISNAQTYSVTYDITDVEECIVNLPPCPIEAGGDEDVVNQNAVPRSGISGSTMLDCDCLKDLFNPIPGKKYVISAWVAQTFPTALTPLNPLTFTHPEIDISFDGAAPLPENKLKASGLIVDGWQRVLGEFIVPLNAETITISLKNNAMLMDVAINCFFDDVRINPFESSIKTFVYNSNTDRLMAEQDNNNYTTFYVYDEEGKLIHKNIETYNGIQTVQEGRQHVKR